MPMSAPFKLEEEIFYWYIIKGDLANGKIVYAGNEKQVKLKRHDPKFGDGHVMTKSRKMKKVGEKWKKSEGVSKMLRLKKRNLLLVTNSITKIFHLQCNTHMHTQNQKVLL